MQDEQEFYLKPKKSLGQHFLRSEKALNTIVDDIKHNCPVFEIGPGEGVLTERLLTKGYTVSAIEIDKRSIEILKEKFKKEISEKRFSIIEKDCLEVDYGDSDYVLVGNIPYYITGAIFRHTFEQEKLPKQVIFLIQKEVAQRIVARDGKESLLSVSVKIFTDKKEDVKILDIVKAGSFVPPPKVDSAIISILPHPQPFSDREGGQDIFFKILRAAFSHKRKFMLANLKTDLEKDLFEKYFEKIKEIIVLKNGEKARAEDVTIETWKEVVEIFN